MWMKFVLVGQGLKEGKVGHEKAFTIISYKKKDEPASVTAEQMAVKISGRKLFVVLMRVKWEK